MLEQEIQIGNKTLKNRLIMAPTNLQLSDHGTVMRFGKGKIVPDIDLSMPWVNR